MSSPVPSNLRSIITDFTADLSVVFPEYAFMWSKWATVSDVEYEKLHAHCLAVYPERFFDIMYTNADIFEAGSKMVVDFLPDVDFRILFNCPGVSDKTKTSIWKYLQLILFTVLGSVNDPKRFGDAANIFEAMDENELHAKMAETMAGVGDFFKNMESSEATNDANEGTGEEASTSDSIGEEPDEGVPLDEAEDLSNAMKDIFEGLRNASKGTEGAEGTEGIGGAGKPGFKMPNPEILKEHMKTLLEGKLGKLAKEFTDEFTHDLKDFFDEGDEANMKSSKDVLMKLIKDPKKMVLILKKITTKLQERMKRGDISQEELMAEMAGLMEKMKDMGGGADFADMMKGLAGTPFMKMFEKGLGGGGAKMDMNKLNQMSKQAEMKERLRKKMEMKKASQAQHAPSHTPSQANPSVIPVGDKNYVVKIGTEVQGKSGLRPPASVQAPLSEEELIKLFSKKDKPAKKAK
uniref:Uncharacterized protein n=1 Tax=viral metagenome TaxID=1070528 RepID=A0A6C0B690_9ZZZZ